MCSWAVQSASYELREESRVLLVNIQKKLTHSAVGAGKVFWAGEVTAVSFAKRKKRGELSLFRLEN